VNHTQERLSITEVFSEMMVYREMGVYYTLVDGGRIHLSVVPRAVPCIPAATQFQHDYENEILLIMLHNGDQDSIRRLDFGRWRVAHGDWGESPGKRAVTVPPRHEEPVGYDH
jgi:hypothetical protein